METLTWPHRSGVASEVGRLNAVLLHRPGRELRRLTPRNSAELLFDGMPWVDRAQDEHDAFAELLRGRGVQVLLLGDLLTETLGIDDARRTGVELMLSGLNLGESTHAYLRDMCRDLSPADLADLMLAGLRNDELNGSTRNLVTSLLADDDFLIKPLPNLLFTRDSSVWIGEQPAVTSLSSPARARENHITELIYTHHPAFAGHGPFYGWHQEHLEGGDVLALSEGVLAIGVGERTTPAGAERLTRNVFARGLAHTIVVVPLAKERAMMHLDTVVTMVDVDAVVMYPNIASTLQAITVTPGGDGRLELREPRPFLEAAADAMGIGELRNIETGLDPHEAEREQWDDGNNTLALAPAVCIAYERNAGTNRRLEEAGIEVLAIAGSELGSGRGGPRCMSCPLSRDPLES